MDAGASLEDQRPCREAASAESVGRLWGGRDRRAAAHIQSRKPAAAPLPELYPLGLQVVVPRTVGGIDGQIPAIARI